MKIQLLTTAHNSLSQGLEIELTERGHDIIVTRAVSGEVMITSERRSASAANESGSRKNPVTFIKRSLNSAFPSAGLSRSRAS